MKVSRRLALLAPALVFVVACRSAPAGCPVTVANGSAPPGERASPGYHGNGQLWTALWTEGTVVFRSGGPGSTGPDGALGMKWPFDTPRRRWYMFGPVLKSFY